KGKKTVPGADVEKCLARQVFRQVNVGELVMTVAVAGRDHALSKINLMEPMNPRNPVLDELSGVLGVRHRQWNYCSCLVRFLAKAERAEALTSVHGMIRISNRQMPVNMAAFDPNLFVARWYCSTVNPEEMPAFAADALEAGFDGPALRRLAALIRPTSYD